ncbi:c-type cytochrome [Gordonia sp. (in: high G+C Gram-positive bacteria)]|uniref:cytochrome bc1 complex diheme cytochrome c subunit n=1 Tax=Gordonia sp. (in: high G+C Gram-positive bacteria) TaxID=84139 RepID=UPI0039E548AF
MSTSPPRPSDPTHEPAPAAPSARAAKARRKLRRRASGTILLLAGLLSAGVITALLTPQAQVAVADPNTQSQAMIDAGKQLYDTSCISCHGNNLQGVEDRGPSLIGVGDAAVYFQVASGRMPAARNDAQATRKPAKFTEAQITQLGKYVQSVSGGPQVYYERNADGTVKTDKDGIPVVAQESLRGTNLGRGSELFRLNCASCHNFTGRGGALSSGKFAPNLDPPSEQQIYTAMLTGPQNMPKFSNRQLSLQEKKDIIGFIKYSSETKQPGGLGLGGFGPVSEGMLMWVVGIGAIVGFAMWMGSRS